MLVSFFAQNILGTSLITFFNFSFHGFVIYVILIINEVIIFYLINKFLYLIQKYILYNLECQCL